MFSNRWLRRYLEILDSSTSRANPSYLVKHTSTIRKVWSILIDDRITPKLWLRRFGLTPPSPPTCSFSYAHLSHLLEWQRTSLSLTREIRTQDPNHSIIYHLTCHSTTQHTCHYETLLWAIKDENCTSLFRQMTFFLTIFCWLSNHNSDTKQ
jgi:hypothetical protein